MKNIKKKLFSCLPLGLWTECMVVHWTLALASTKRPNITWITLDYMKIKILFVLFVFTAFQRLVLLNNLFALASTFKPKRFLIKHWPNITSITLDYLKIKMKYLTVSKETIGNNLTLKIKYLVLKIKCIKRQPWRREMRSLLPRDEVACGDNGGDKIKTQKFGIWGVYRALLPKSAIPHLITIQNMSPDRK